MSLLPAGVRLIERGWLSSNQIVFLAGERATVVDSGYVSEAGETVAKVREALDGRRLGHLVNTHSHSDHIGGNAALQRAFGCRITIPSGMAQAVEAWDEDALMLKASCQRAERFRADSTLCAGERIEMGGLEWLALPAPGHDATALVFHNSDTGMLITGDALWRRGFGLVFPALLGDPEGFDRTRETLERIGALSARVVLPGHGAAFAEVDEALEEALSRLSGMERDADRLARHGLRVMLVFGLLEMGSLERSAVSAYLSGMPFARSVNERFLGLEMEDLSARLVADLERAGALRVEEGRVIATRAE